MLDEHDPRLRSALLARYEELAANPKRRDPGTYLRAALLRSLRPLAEPDDLALLEEAAMTYEYSSPIREVAGMLRGAALVTMYEMDRQVAVFHAARLLHDKPPRTDEMSGEPALTAVQVLAAHGEAVVLYGFLSAPATPVAEVWAEALRAMAGAPATVVRDLLQLYGESRDEIVLLGLFDLVLNRADAELFGDFLMGFLRDSDLTDMCRYLATAIVAGRRTVLIERMRLLMTEVDKKRSLLLEEALTLL
jgi:hypothetical protein